MEDRRNKPECYIPNNDTYPLCIGKDKKDYWLNCNLYEHMVEPHDYD